MYPFLNKDCCILFISNVAINSQISPFYGGVWLSLIFEILRVIFVFHFI